MLKLLCLAVCVAVSHAIVCLPNTCETVRCAAVKDCKGVIQKNGGFCGCCDACITQLREGESCAHPLLLGVPSTMDCGQGLYCDDITFRCKQIIVKRQAGPCQVKLAQIEATLASSNPMLLGLERPRCDAEGNYLGMQFMGAKAYCVTKNGTAIDGYTVNRWEAGNMNCQCAREQYDYMKTGLIGKMFYCAPNGNYAQVRKAVALCTASLREYELQMTSSNHMLLGLEKPRCDSDGNFQGMQFAGSQAYCVTKDGTNISGYMVNRWETGDDMNCQCARDQYAYQQTGLIGKMFHCDQNGNYAKIGCTGSVCYCQDQNGHQIGNSVPIYQQTAMNC